MFSSSIGISHFAALIALATSLSACGVGPSRYVQVGYENACQHDGSRDARAACAEQAQLMRDATARGARGYNLGCLTPTGSAREIRICTKQFRKAFILGGVDLNYSVKGPTGLVTTRKY